jgi:bifunctional non-homologous end joining protein LigD
MHVAMVAAPMRPVPLGFIAPALPKLAASPPEGDAWLHEIKHDGYRTMLVIDRGTVRAFTRGGHDWTDRYRRIVAEAKGLPVSSAVLDGEVIVQDGRGVSDLAALQRALVNEPHRLLFFAFDLLHLDGEDLRDQPLIERRERLRELTVGHAIESGAIQFSDHVVGPGAEVFAAAERLGLEGIVSKKAASRYRSGPTSAWLKTKAWSVEPFTLLGAKLDRRDVPVALLARNGEEARSATPCFTQAQLDRPP